MRLVSEKESSKVLLFLQLEAEIDAENFKEFQTIEPSHLTKGKITAMGKLGGQWKRSSDALMKKIKTTMKKTNEWDRIDYFGKERTWIT